jgi:hypothetical protein
MRLGGKVLAGVGLAAAAVAAPVLADPLKRCVVLANFT